MMKSVSPPSWIKVLFLVVRVFLLERENEKVQTKLDAS